MAEADLNLILRQYERILREMQGIRERLNILPSMRDEQALMREELRNIRTALGRVEDTLTFNVLDRIQKLESEEP
jgi:hypothetical protein